MNNITIELCAEDRARLDKLTTALENAAARAPIFGMDLAKQTEGENYCRDDVDATEQLADKLDAQKAPAETATEPQEAKEETTQANTPAEPETPTAAENAAPWEPAEAKPAATLEQIQQKVVQLAAGFGGTKKAAVREIVNAYAKKVSDLPADKWDEVWEKLVQLESEG